MGQIEILRGFPAGVEGFSRTLRILTPDLYERDRSARFGVLYMHDGQNVLAHPESATYPSWSANIALERLMAEGRIGRWMIVAVDHSGPGRFEDYSPWPEPRAGVSGRGETYARFLLHELKPWVDARYRTEVGPQGTAAMGASLGGLVSLYLGWRYPDVVGRVGGVSPSVMWCEGALFRNWTAHTRKWSRIYLDVGTEEYQVLHGVEMDYLAQTRAFYEHLGSLGYADWELRLWVEPGAHHHERDWERRLPEALAWLLA
ncbi:MAG: alpha/beta hydrolase [Myxococcales bacterium]|nr:alpha/beta hydrolase [Myxococcales bacterium]